MRVTGFLVFGCCLLLPSLHAADKPLEKKEWKVGDDQREGMLHIPDSATKTDTPVVFAFHGHGGQAKVVAERWGYHKQWPEAIVVYLQGLNTEGKTDPEGKKPGWQHMTGDHGDRDLKLFDTVLAQLKKDYKVDSKRIYVTGHSNGGGFTYLLWATRGDVFAAVAPSAGGARLFKDLKPKPVMHLAGEKDTVVPFEGQQKTMEALRKLNGTDEKGEQWGKYATKYTSKNGPPVVTWIHPGTHAFPADAPAAVVKFFKENVQK